MKTTVVSKADSLNNFPSLLDNTLFLANICENLPDMIFMKEAKELRFVRFNKAAEDILGYKREELIGKNDYDFFPESEADFFTRKDREVLDGGKVVDIPEEPIHTKHQGLRWLHTKKIPILDEHGQPLFLLGISRDITELKAAREKSLELVSDLEEKVRERTVHLETINQELLRLSRVTTEFSIMVTHELRTPLSSMKEGVQQILDGLAGPINPDQNEILVIVKNNMDRLNRMISNVLEFQRMDSGLQQPKMTRGDLTAILNEEIRSVAMLAENKSITILREYEQTPLFVVCDTDKIRQLVANLLDNALKFTPPGKTITVNSKLDAKRVILTVSDTGIGISPEDRGNIFQLFGQGKHEGLWKTGGFGVGLAVCKKIVEMHGGTIDLQSELGKGTTFSIVLPLN